MARVTFDTNIFIKYRPAVLPAGFLMSVVVLQELTAGALDKSELQHLDASRRAHENAETLLVSALSATCSSRGRRTVRERHS
jgi:predicted nucleic acid-binding protein